MKGPKNGVLKASVRDTPLELRRNFQESTCMLLVSVGQQYHEGEKLQATINYISNNFKYCTIMVCDTLQKYNLIPNYNQQDAEYISFKNGTEWVERNNSIVSSLLVPYNIIRWKDITSNIYYIDKLTLVRELYEFDRTYKTAFDDTINDYFSRLIKRGELVNKNESYNNCLNYLLEECAGMLLWADAGFNFEIYPNKRAKVLAATYELIIKPNYTKVLVPILLRFKRYAVND